MSTPRRTVLSWLALLLLLTVGAGAQNDTPPASPAFDNPEQRTISRIRDLFDIDLPFTERPGQVRFSFQPIFRDLLNESYLRVPLEFRWGVNDHFELNSDMETYFHHGLRKGDSSYGLDELFLGAKYALLGWLEPVWNASVGFNVAVPVSRPPVGMTDGHDHFSPYIVFDRKLRCLPGLSGFLNARPDFITESSTPGSFGRNEPHSNSLTVSPGLLFDHYDWHYTLEVDATTTRIIGTGSHDFLTIRPGVFWDLPRALVLRARGRWIAGFNLKFVFGPDGNTVGTGGRLRGELNLTHLFRSGP